MFTRVMAIFKASNTHCARSSFVATSPLFLRIQRSQYVLNVILNGLRILSSKGCMAWDMWLGMVETSRPISVCATSKVTQELCPSIISICQFSLEMPYILPIWSRKWLIHSLNIAPIIQASFFLHGHTSPLLTPNYKSPPKRPTLKYIKIRNARTQGIDAQQNPQPFSLVWRNSVHALYPRHAKTPSSPTPTPFCLCPGLELRTPFVKGVSWSWVTSTTFKYHRLKLIGWHSLCILRI